MSTPAEFPVATRAFRNFEASIRNTNELLKLGILGISQHHGEITNIQEKIADAERIAISSGDTVPEDFFEANRLPDGRVSLRMGTQHANVLREAIEAYTGFVDRLKYHLHNILCVAIWASFETYVHQMLVEFYTRFPNQLSSDRTVTYEEILENTADVVGYLVDVELDHVGRLSIDPLNRYLKSRIKFELPPAVMEQMRELYFLRNIIAHSSGIVRDRQKKFVPKTVLLDKATVLIPVDYLKRANGIVEAAVSAIEKSVVGQLVPPSVLAKS